MRTLAHISHESELRDIDRRIAILDRPLSGLSRESFTVHEVRQLREAGASLRAGRDAITARLRSVR
jgi:hypothetical protein